MEQNVCVRRARLLYSMQGNYEIVEHLKVNVGRRRALMTIRFVLLLLSVCSSGSGRLCEIMVKVGELQIWCNSCALYAGESFARLPVNYTIYLAITVTITFTFILNTTFCAMFCFC